MSAVLKAIISIMLIGIIAAVTALWYVKPEQKLDLSYTELPLRDKLADMIIARKPEMTLTESEVNELLKKALAARPNVREDVTVTGARFALQGDKLTADVNLLIRQRFEAAATLRFDLDWKEPYLTAVHTGTSMKRLDIPAAWFQLQPLRVNLNDYLPRLAAIRGIAFEPSGVKLSFKLR